MSRTVVLSIPAAAYQWSPLRRGLGSCSQEAVLTDEKGAMVCRVTVTWPAPLPSVPVVCHSEGRHAGEQD